jgi:hypothetical protein
VVPGRKNLRSNATRVRSTRCSGLPTRASTAPPA